MPTPTDLRGDRAPRPAGENRPPGFALRFSEGKAFVVLQNAPLWGVGRVDDLSLEIEGISFPFDVTGGADQFQGRLLGFHRLQVTLEEEALAAAVRLRLAGGASVRVDEI